MEVSLLFDIRWKRDRPDSVAIGVRKGWCFADTGWAFVLHGAGTCGLSRQLDRGRIDAVLLELRDRAQVAQRVQHAFGDAAARTRWWPAGFV